MSKYEDTRIVTFKEDYTRPKKDKEGKPVMGPDGKQMQRVFYKKNSIHAIHKLLVEKLREQGAKMDVKELEIKKVHAERKKRLADRKKKQVELSYAQ